MNRRYKFLLRLNEYLKIYQLHWGISPTYGNMHSLRPKTILVKTSIEFVWQMQPHYNFFSVSH